VHTVFAVQGGDVEDQGLILVVKFVSVAPGRHSPSSPKDGLLRGGGRGVTWVIPLRLESTFYGGWLQLAQPCFIKKSLA
jgi:hypothetical protein